MKQQRIRFANMLTAVMLSSIAAPVFAEAAPVFDADAMQQQAFESGDSASDLPPPPAPGGGSAAQEGAFVPMPQASAPTPTAEVPVTTHVPATSGMSTAQRLRRLEQQVASAQGSESGQRVDSLQEQVQSLRGQVEQLLHQVEHLQSQQKAMYSDLDKRMAGAPADKSVKRAMSAGVTDTADTNELTSPEIVPTKPGKSSKIAAAKQSAKTIVGAPAAMAASKTQKAAGDQPDDAEEQQIYQTAYNLIKAKKYEDAVTTLQGMLKKYPSGQFASNAHYWLGELYGLMGKNDQALTEFATVVSSYPQSPRVSDAQLKVGLIYSAQSKWSDAKSSFKKVVSIYPGTASARVASEQLKQIKTSGH